MSQPASAAPGPGRAAAAAPAPAGLPAVLAVDGGNSKTDVALVSADGSLLAGIRGPGMNAPRDGVAQTLNMLGGLVRRAAEQAGRGSSSPVAAHTSACLANVDLPEEEEEMRAALQARGWSPGTSVVNDTFAVLRAGLAVTGRGLPDGSDSTWGVAVTCGAGVNCVGRAWDGRSTRYLALGDISGDWGGGYGLGRAALWWAARAEDGRGQPTALRAAVAARFGVATVREVALGLHQGRIDEERLADLAPVLLATARDGDEVARRLVDCQAAEICLLALTAMRRLDLLDLATPVILGGGLLTARDPLLMGGITSRLRQEAPRAVASVIDVPPVAGAALLGLDQVRASPAAQGRLRDAYVAATPASAG